MKRVLAVLLTIFFVVSFAGCQQLANDNARKLNEIQDILTDNAYGREVERPAVTPATAKPAQTSASNSVGNEKRQGIFSFLNALQPTETKEPEYRYHMAFLQSSNRTEWKEWYRANTNTIQAEAGKGGIYLDSRDSLNSMFLQTTAIVQLATQANPKFDVIAVSPLRSEAEYWNEALGEVKKSGAYSIVVNRPIYSDETLYDAYVGPNVVEQGQTAAQWIAEAVNQGEKNIVVLCGNEGDSVVRERQAAFERSLAETPELKIYRKEYGNDTALGGQESLAKLLEDGAKIDVVFTHNDDLAMGAIAAINAVDGLESGKDILVVSVGASKVAMDAILTGTLNATVENSADVGKKVIEIADKMMAGEKVPKQNYLETNIFDAKNVKDAYAFRIY